MLGKLLREFQVRFCRLAMPLRFCGTSQLLFGLLQTHLGVRFAGGSESADAADGAVHIGHHAEVAARLRTALTMGDIGEIQALAQQLAESGTADAPLGERIGRLAAAFDFEGLGALADSLAPRMSSSMHRLAPQSARSISRLRGMT